MGARRVTAGELNQRVTPLVPTLTEDAAGQRVESYEPRPELWANVRPLRGREWFAAEAAQSSAVMAIRIRYRAGVTGRWHWRWRDVEYVALGEPANVDAGNHTLEIMVAAAGPPA